MANKKAKGKPSLPKQQPVEESPSPPVLDNVEQRVYDLMFYEHLSRDAALGQALAEGCKYKGR